MTDISLRLDARLGRIHARQRLGIEDDHEAQIFGQGLNFFHLENWYSIHAVIRNGLRFTGLYGRGCRNAENVQLRLNTIVSSTLPRGFEGFRILHLSDLHTDMSGPAMDRVTELVAVGPPPSAVATSDGTAPGTASGVADAERGLGFPFPSALCAVTVNV